MAKNTEISVANPAGGAETVSDSEITSEIVHRHATAPGSIVMAVLFALLLLGVVYTYFPGDKIAIISNDQLDSFFPAFEVLPPVWETVFRLDPDLDRHLSGMTVNFMGESEFSIRRIIASVFPSYTEFSVFYLVHILSLFVSSYYVCVQILRDLAGHIFAFRDYALAGFAALFVTVLPHSAVVLGVLVSLNLFVLGALAALHPEREKWRAVALFVGAGFFANFALGGYFFIPATLVLALFIAARKGVLRQAAPLLGLGALVMVVFDYRVFLGLIVPGEASHRADWLVGQTYSFGTLFDISSWVKAITEPREVISGTTAHYHYQWNTENLLVVLVGALLAVLALTGVGAAIKARRFRLVLSPDEKPLLIAAAYSVFAILVILMGYGVFRSGLLSLDIVLGLPFQFERVIVALPIVAGLLLCSLACLAAKRIVLPENNWTWVLAVALFWAWIGPEIHTPTSRKAENNAFYAENGENNPFIPKYNTGSRYAAPLYDAVKDKLGPGWADERTLTIAHDPMATAYNGFATLDGYFANYPERYQQEFLRVISPAFDKLEPKVVNRYMGWGNRLNVPVIDWKDDKSVSVHIDACAFEDLGGTLVMAMRPIANPERSQLVRVDEVSSPDRSVRATFHLYRPDSSLCDAVPASAAADS